MPQRNRLRIAYARIAQESNCFSPVPTTLEDFRRSHWLEGPALARACRPDAHEAEGYLKNAELTGFVDVLAREPEIEAIPLFSAWAIPGGPLDRTTFDALAAQLEEALRGAGPLDGVLLCLHGAMGAVGTRDPDTALIHAARRGAPGARVAVTHDLHANLTQARVEAADVITVYRTNPHRDQRRTGQLAARALVRALRGEVTPRVAWRSLPVILGGGRTVDFLPPVRSIFSRLTALHRNPRVLSANVLFCHPWNDDPALGWSTLITTDGEPALAEELADELAERAWAVRHEQPPAFATPEQAIAEARDATLARKLGTVVLCDASDVVSAGAPGDSTHLLGALLRGAKDLKSYVPLRDPVAVAELWPRSEGAFVELEVGGRLDPASSAPIAIDGKVLAKRDHPALGRMVALDLGHLQLVITEGHAMAVKPEFYADLGLSPWKADIVVVKNFFPFRVFFAHIARKVIYVKTRGATDLDAASRLATDVPVWPRDAVFEWRASDARRRAAQG